MTVSKLCWVRKVNIISLTSRVIALAQASPKGISDKDIQKEIPDLPPEKRAVLINKLLAQVTDFILFYLNMKSKICIRFTKCVCIINIKFMLENYGNNFWASIYIFLSLLLFISLNYATTYSNLLTKFTYTSCLRKVTKIADM